MVFCCTSTPCACTDWGSRAMAWLTRFCTSTWASSGSVSMVK